MHPNGNQRRAFIAQKCLRERDKQAADKFRSRLSDIEAQLPRDIAHRDDTHRAIVGDPSLSGSPGMHRRRGRRRCNKFINLASYRATRGDYKSTH